MNTHSDEETKKTDGSSTSVAAYIYVASSWRNPLQPEVCARLSSAGIEHYDFRNPQGGTEFSWREVRPSEPALIAASTPGGATVSVPAVKPKGSDWEHVSDYLKMINHPRATEGFVSDFDAMMRADTFVMVLPCGKSAHLELGWAVGAGKRTVILLEDPVEPELMYKMVDKMVASLDDLMSWLDATPTR